MKFPIIDLYVTGKCNFRCPYCFGEDSNKGDITEKVFTRVIEFAKFCGSSIGLTGGEPLLHKQLRSLVGVAVANQVPLILRTNGMMLNNYMDIVGAFKWIGVSVDGASSLVRRMRPSSPGFNYQDDEKWKLPLSNIQLVNSQHPNVKILLASLVSSFNSLSLIELAKCLRDENVYVDKWKLYQFTRNNFRSLIASDKYETTDESLHSLAASLKQYYHGEIVTKVGEGNCLIVDTDGLVRVNSCLLGSVFEDEHLLLDRIRNAELFSLIQHNKEVTYDAT